MRASLIIASHNEGDLLSKTVQSCLDTMEDLHCEIVVADDASHDGSIEELRKQFEPIRIVAHPERRGVSATKDLGARQGAATSLSSWTDTASPSRVPSPG